MPAVWTTPRSWVTGELVTAAQLNSHLRDNLEFLKSPPTAAYVLNEASNYTTTSTSFVNVDGVKLALTVTTAGGDVLVGFSGTVETGVNTVFFDVEMDGVRVGGDDGLIAVTAQSARGNVSFVRLVQNVLPGVHTFKLQWKVGASTSTLYAGAGTSLGDLHPQFFVREVS